MYQNITPIINTLTLMCYVSGKYKFDKYLPNRETICYQKGSSKVSHYEKMGDR